MKAIKPKVTLISHSDKQESELKFIEYVGRLSQNSQKDITETSYKAFILDQIKAGQYWGLNHISASVHFVCSFSVSRKLKRFPNIFIVEEPFVPIDKDNDLIFIAPYFCYEGTSYYNQQLFDKWVELSKNVEKTFLGVVKSKVPLEEAKNILPLYTKTEVLITTTLAEWRNLLIRALEDSPTADVLLVLVPLVKAFYKDYPEIFEDIDKNYPFTKEQPSKEVIDKETCSSDACKCTDNSCKL